MRSSGSDRQWGRLGFLAFLAVVLLATVARVPPIDSGLPYSTYVDENYVVRPANHVIADRTVDPGAYNYPSLMMGLTAIAGTVGARLVGDWTEFDRSVRSSEASAFYDVAPPHLLLAGRLLTLASSVGTVALGMLLFRPIAGRRIALLGGLLLALSPILVTRSAIVIVDTPSAFFWMLALLLASRVGTSSHPRWTSAAAGVATGLATTSKYTGAIVAIGVVLLVLGLTSGWRERTRRVLLAGAAAAGTVAVTMPVLLFDHREVIAEYRTLTEDYLRASTPSTWTQLRDPAELGVILLAPAGAGLAYLAWHRPTRLVTLAWAASALSFLLLLQRYSYQPVRNMLPLVPFLAFGTATTLVVGTDAVLRQWVARRAGAQRTRILGVAVPTVLALGIGGHMYASGIAPYYDRSLDVVDSRSLAVDWLTRSTSPDDTVLIAEELVILPSELDRIDADVVVLPALDEGSAEEAADADADIVVTGTFRFLPEFPGPVQAWADPPGAPVATFGTSEAIPAPNLWRGSGQIIEIHSASPQRALAGWQRQLPAATGAPPGNSRNAS